MAINTLLNSLENLFLDHLGILLSFILGAIFTIFYTKYQRKKQSENMRELYLTWYSLSKESIENQLTQLRDYIKQIKQNSLGGSILKLSNLRIEVLLTFEYDKLFQAFVYDRYGKRDENAKQIFLLTGNINYLVIAVEAVKIKFEKSQNHYQDWQSRWNYELKEFHKLMFDYYLQYRGNMGLFVEEVTAIKNSFRDNNHKINIPTEKIINELILPIESVIHSHLVYENNSKLLKAILSRSQELQTLELEKNQLTNSSVEILYDYILSIEEALRSSKKNYTYFLQSRFKILDKIKKLRNKQSKK